MSQCENNSCENCENCDEDHNEMKPDVDVSLRTVFLNEAPEGAFTDEFREFCLNVWPEDEPNMSARVALRVLRFLLQSEESQICEEAGQILQALFDIAFNSIPVQELNEIANEEGFDYNEEDATVVLRETE